MEKGNITFLYSPDFIREIKQIVADELERIKNDPALAHLLQQK